MIYEKRMRQTNRILSFLLFVLMLLSTAPVTVFAAGETCVCGFTPHKCFTSDLTVYILEHGGYCDICKLFFIEPHSYNENGKCVCGGENLNGVCIGDQWLNDGDYLTVDSDLVTSKPSVGYAYLYDNVIMLHNFVYSGENTDERISSSLVYTEMELEIIVKGANTLYCIYGGTFLFNAGSAYYAVVADTEIIIGDAFTDYTVIEVGGSYFVLADGDGEVLNDGILKADEDDKIQMKESWVVFPEAPVTAFDGKLSVSDELLWSLLVEYSNVFLFFLDSTDQHMRV